MRLFSPVTVLFAFAVVVFANKDAAVDIATAYDSKQKAGWAYFLAWQQPNGTIMLRDQTLDIEQAIDQPIAAKKHSPLAIYFRPLVEAREVRLYFLDDHDNIIDTSVIEKKDGTYYNWNSVATKHKSSSGLAVTNVYGVTRIFMVNGDVLQQVVDNNVTDLAPVSKQTSLSATVQAGSNDTHVFYMTDSKSLSSLTFDGKKWTQAIPEIPDFSAKENTKFAAAAWSDPFIVRIFYVRSNDNIGEWTFRDGSWKDTSDSLPPVGETRGGQPVAAGRSVNGTGRYLDYYFGVGSGKIISVSKNYSPQGFFVTEIASIDFPEGWNPDRIMAISFGILASLFALIAVVLAAYQCKYSRAAKLKKLAEPLGE